VLPLAGWSDRKWSATGLALFAVLAVALIPAVISAEHPGARAIRWAARLVAIGLFAREYVRVYWTVLRTNNSPTEN